MAGLIQKHQVLLINDDKDEHFIFREALEDIHYSEQYIVADGWQQAEKILSYFKPDFIFLDMNMPGKNGLEYLKEIKQKEELKPVCVYLYSTGLSDKDCKVALHIGAEDCIKKTASLKELSSVLSNILIH